MSLDNSGVNLSHRSLLLFVSYNTHLPSFLTRYHFHAVSNFPAFCMLMFFFSLTHSLTLIHLLFILALMPSYSLPKPPSPLPTLPPANSRFQYTCITLLTLLISICTNPEHLSQASPVNWWMEPAQHAKNEHKTPAGKECWGFYRQTEIRNWTEPSSGPIKFHNLTREMEIKSRKVCFIWRHG